ncbi:MAG TPA: glutaredoxin domain-containing protein [Candidatus Paceibacterota bacterium]|nr:glutaredoxin domain-containing protein [Candidatus Paceibacterota bacterium]
MKSVTIYSTQYCVYCKLAKEYFTKNNIAFQEFDVGTDLAKREEMVKKSGQMGVPVIDIDGEIIVGFNKPKVAGLLNIPE